MKPLIKLSASIILIVLALVGATHWKHIRYWYQRATLHGKSLDPAPIHYGYTVHGSTFASEGDYRRATNSTDSVSQAMKENHKGSFKVWDHGAGSK